MVTPFGRISRFPIFFIAAALVAIVVGLILPGHTGDLVEAIAWAIVALAIFIRIGIRTTPP